MRAILLLALCSCDGGAVEADPPELEVVVGTGDSKALETMLRVEAPARIDAIGATSDGRMLAVASGRVYVLDGGQLVHRQLYAAPGEPTSLGQVHHVAPRARGGAWIAAETGLFALDALYVTHTVLSDEVGEVTAISESTVGKLDGTWLAASSDLFRAHDDRIERLLIDGFNPGADDVAVDPEGDFAMALLAGELARLAPTPRGIRAFVPPASALAAVGEAGALGAAIGVLYGAGTGLLRWTHREVTPWTHFTLTSTEAAEPVRAMSIDPISGAAWVRTDSRLLRVDASRLESFTSEDLAVDPAAPLCIDRFGDVWTVDGRVLVRLSTGELSSQQLTFGGHIRPFLDQHCASCHDFSDDYDAFVKEADEALARVRRGDMPRCDGGQICPQDERLVAADWAELETWIRLGKPE